ncbi:YTH-domain-containing protein [Trichoderma citrinoviride]|uniref:YTH-domain-containing protein n=1 Tax=Trichoderma citrinoviride TaxID=58853 RepID=A0A2T4BCY8_9HYPO|nr:YTH-domain-containing protein [Trichoderma citrinoviride]PTB67200.1 YTH-domain-containing protein [Trichoderma citrinoviride]
MIATDSESDTLSGEATRTTSQDIQGQHHQHGLTTISLDADSDLRLWLQHTGFFDVEHRQRVLVALRKLKDIDEQRCKIVSEMRSSADYYLVSPTPPLSSSTMLASPSSLSLAAAVAPATTRTRQAAGYDYVDARSAAFAGSSERCGSEISSLTRGAAGSDNGGYMAFGNRPVSRQELDVAAIPSMAPLQNPQPSAEATPSPVDPDYDSVEAESPPLLSDREEEEEEAHDAAAPRCLAGKGRSANRYPPAQALSPVPKQESRYFLVKSFNVSNVELSQRDGLWITKAKNGSLFASAFKTHKNVYLIFSINKSKAFQGYARMASAPDDSIPPAKWMNNITWEASGPFRITWLNTDRTEFWRLGDLKNPLNDGKPVFVGRDGQEYPEACGRKMVRILDRVERGTRERERRRGGGGGGGGGGGAAAAAAVSSSSSWKERRLCGGGGDGGKLEGDGGEANEDDETSSPLGHHQVSDNGDAASASTAEDLLLLEY